MNEKTRDPDDERAAPEPEPPAAGEPAVPGDDQAPPRDEAASESEPAPASEDAANAPEPAPAAAPAPARRGIATGIALLGLVLALVSLAAAGYLWWAGRDSGAAVAAHDATIGRLSGTAEDVQGALREMEARIGELDAADADQADELAALEAQLGEIRDRFASIPGRLASVERSVASLQGISAGDRDAWLLAEAEHYLQIANAQLQLAGNPERALLALEFADQRLRQLSDPGLSEVRRALAQAVRAVEAMERPDIQGISMTLASLAESVESLPLPREAAQPDRAAAEPPEDMSGLDRALASVRAAFSDIVTVRRTDEEVTPLMSPEAEYFLRTNLALKLQTARLALLRGEQSIFEQSLADAAAWLREYYDADSRAVQSALQTLSELRAVDFAATPPDISESLRLLREFRRRSAAAVPAAPADEPAQ